MHSKHRSDPKTKLDYSMLPACSKVRDAILLSDICVWAVVGKCPEEDIGDQGVSGRALNCRAVLHVAGQ